MSQLDVTIEEFGPTEAARSVPRRTAGAHKWGVGGLMIIAGAPGYVGAATLCAMAAGRAGAGIVNLAVSRSLVGAIAPVVPEVGFTILPEGDLGSNGKRVLDAISKKAEKCAAFVIGPGLGDDDYARDLMATLLGISDRTAGAALGFGVRRPGESESAERASLFSYGKPILIDADGLNALARIDEWWTRIPEHRLVLTPHVGEFTRLMDWSADDVLGDPGRAAIEAARTFRQTVLLKGSPTIVTDGSKLVHAVDAPPSLATAGSGDVLAGTIGALLAQGSAAMDAANLGVYAGIRAARRLETELGTLGVIASDLPRAIAVELAELERA